MKTLILSDIHVGDSRLVDEQPIMDLLLGDWDRLILNGDIVDQWIPEYKCKVMESQIIKTINDLSKKSPVIWNLGNHDPHASEASTILPHVKILNKFKFENYLSIHGHQVYWWNNRSLIDKIATNINSFIFKLTKLDLQTYFRNSWFVKMRTEYKRKKIIKKFGKHSNNIIIGHTHLPGVFRIKNHTLIDGGSTTLTKTYVMVEDGVPQLRKVRS